MMMMVMVMMIIHDDNDDDDYQGEERADQVQGGQCGVPRRRLLLHQQSGRWVQLMGVHYYAIIACVYSWVPALVPLPG